MLVLVLSKQQVGTESIQNGQYCATRFIEKVFVGNRLNPLSDGGKSRLFSGFENVLEIELPHCRYFFHGYAVIKQIEPRNYQWITRELP